MATSAARPPESNEQTPLLSPDQRHTPHTCSDESSLTTSSLDDSISEPDVDAFPGLGGISGYSAGSESSQDGSEAATLKRGERKSTTAILKVVSVLLIGMFTSNADGSLVLATHPTIASEFDDLEDSSWLFTAFVLAGAATQAMYGKLSDIYGRRAILVLSYILFAFGCFVVGVGPSMGEVVGGRVISGSGGSAITVVSSLIVTDLVPLRDLAAWQAGMNLASTVGRSIGGPIGGWLADTIGWRWSFLGQAPIFLFALILCLLFMPADDTAPANEQARMVSGEHHSRGQASDTMSLARVDWLGALCLALLILSFLTPIEIGGSKIPWTHPFIFVFLGLAVFLAVLFAVVETWWAREPIFPLSLLNQRNLVICYLVATCQTAAQLGLMFAVPLYFQVTQRASNTVAGAHLFPAVAGNAIGGILSGILIKRSGQYKSLTVFGTLLSSTSYLLLLLRWHGHTNIWESFYILPGGFGMGIVMSSTFVAVQASISQFDRAAATSGMYLFQQIGAILGLASVSAIIIETMKSDLDVRLVGLGLDSLERTEIIEHASSNVDYIDQAEARIGDAIVAAYVKGLSFSHAVSLICSLVAFLTALLVRERKL